MKLSEQLKTLEKFTEEPDAFETECERQLQVEWEIQNDKLHLQQEKEANKYIVKMYCILNALKSKMNIDFTFKEQIRSFQILFFTKGAYDAFMIQEKNSKNFNECLAYPLNKKSRYEQLNKDEFGVRYITIYIK